MIIRPVRRKHINTYTLAGIIPFLAHSLLAPATPLALAVSAAILLNVELKRLKSKFIITDNELFLEEGLINKSRTRIRLEDLTKLKVRQTFFQRIMRYGDIEFEIRSSGSVRLKNVSRPSLIIDRIRELLKE